MYKFGKDIISSITSRISNQLSSSQQQQQQRSAGTVNNLNDTSNSTTSTNNSTTNNNNNNNNTNNDNENTRNSLHSTTSNNNVQSSNQLSSSLSSSMPTSLNQRINAISSNSQPQTHHGKKRNRTAADGHKTPMLVVQHTYNDSSTSTSSSSSSSSNYKKQKRAGSIQQPNSLLLCTIPQEVIETYIFSFLTTGSDYHALQLTCKTFYQWSNNEMGMILKHVDLNGNEVVGSSGVDGSCSEGGNIKEKGNGNFGEEDGGGGGGGGGDSGKGSILKGVDSPVVGVERLYKFANAGNQQALYMIGMIAAYCHGDKIGVTILKQTARQGCLRSAYALGLILRDSDKTLSESYLQNAISKGYLPACQELLSSQTVKEKFGDLGPEVLKSYFDPIGLNRLLSRCYLHSNGVRGMATSHCWNPCCGRWALKATQSTDGRTPQFPSPSKCLPAVSRSVEVKLLHLVKKDLCDGDFDCGDDGIRCSLAAATAAASSGSAKSATTSSNVAIGGKIDLEGGTDEDMNRLGSLSSSSSSSNTFCTEAAGRRSFRVSRMKMCSSCRRAKYCSKLCQVYDWRSGRHKQECQYL